jgi:hypothetical protein
MQLALRKQGFVEQPVHRGRRRPERHGQRRLSRAVPEPQAAPAAPPMPAVRQAIVIGAGMAGASAATACARAAGRSR